MIFGIMKDNDLKYFAFEFYISIFNGLKDIRVQKYQKNRKNGFFGDPFSPFLEGSQNLYFWYSERT